ncbi:hypothetical protein C8R45DRAFT_1016618 [Mycena sanguinolenta]|nr:hypothetical protein C8R45DRAFT_1016618 [Mycena sanguinolenta]
MRRLFRSMSRSASDNGSIASSSMPPSYQTVEANDTLDLQTSASGSVSDSRLRVAARRSSNSRLAARRSSRSMGEPPNFDPGPTGYCYYRIYTPDGAIPSETAFNSLDPYLGRIAVRSVPPPQTVESLRRRLATVEKLLDHPSHQVFCNIDGAIRSMYKEEWILLSSQALSPCGTTPETAFALLLGGADVEKVAKARIIPPRVPSTEAHPIYLYYRLFTRNGEDTSNVRFNRNDPALGRIERILLAPPHTADSIKHQIARSEGKRIYAHFFLMQDDSPGLKKDDPMILVQPERRAGLYNRPVEVILAYTVQEQSTGHELTVGSKCVSDGVLVKQAIYCEEHRKWDCTCGRRSRSRSVSKVFCCEISGHNYKTYLPARNPVFFSF